MLVPIHTGCRYRGADMIEITKRVATAREMGDLSENAEYHAAREDQGMLQARINDLSDRLSRSVIVDTSTLPKDSVAFGSKVKVMDLEGEPSLDHSELARADVMGQVRDMSLGAETKECSAFEHVEVSELCTRLHAQLELASACRIEPRSFQAACETHTHPIEHG